MAFWERPLTAGCRFQGGLSGENAHDYTRDAQETETAGNVLITVDARGIVNLLGQDLEGDNVVPGVNLVREIDLP